MNPPPAMRTCALVCGLFLGLALWKFGNPVVLDKHVAPPQGMLGLWDQAWPLRWAGWLLAPLVLWGGMLALRHRQALRVPPSLWLLPLAWLAWQFAAALHSVDPALTAAALWQFSGCVACYFLGATLLGRNTLLHWLLPGLLAAFVFCLVRGAEQRLFEYPETRRMLLEGQACGWTNHSPASLEIMRQDRMIIATNGVDVANPVILEKLRKGRVSGTLVYPNALAGAILLLWPVSLALLFASRRRLRFPVRAAACVLACGLGAAVLYWTGSKLGWLLALGLAGLFLLRLDWPRHLKVAATVLVLAAGLGLFAVRFQGYFSAGATSVGARLDYWRAAVQTMCANPVSGTGPGTFQRPYERIKSPGSEMARLAHNDYLEQFSDSGIPGGLAYVAWVLLALLHAGRRAWRSGDSIGFALFAGVLAWFVQGFGEFSLYVPGLAWPAFALLGICVARSDGGSMTDG